MHLLGRSYSTTLVIADLDMNFYICSRNGAIMGFKRALRFMTFQLNLSTTKIVLDDLIQYILSYDNL